MYSENLVNALNLIAYQYQPRIQSEIATVFKQSRYRNTGAGADSFKISVIPGTLAEAPQIKIEFVDYVNIINIGKVQFTSMPPINAITKWAENRNFERVPGYKNGAPNLPPWKAKQRIAWAVAIGKKKYDYWKAKPWRKKSLSSVLKQMNILMLREFDAAIDRDLKIATKV